MVTRQTAAPSFAAVTPSAHTTASVEWTPTRDENSPPQNDHRYSKRVCLLVIAGLSLLAWAVILAPVM